MIDKNRYEEVLSHIESNLNQNDIIKFTTNSNKMILKDQIKYFSFFLKKSLEYNDKNIVLDILPWMYHAFSSQGFKYEYFLFLYDMWMLNGKKILNDTEYESLKIILEAVRDSHEELVNSSKNYISKVDHIPSEYIEDMEKFKTALLNGDSSMAREMFQFSVKDFKELQSFYNYIIYPSMVEIGKAWENGIISPAQEHLASTIVLEILTLLYTKLEFPDTTKSKIVIGTVTNEFHEIAAIMLANALEIKGFDVEYLGYNISNETFMEKIKELKPQIVALSIAMPFNLDNTTELVKEIKKQNSDITIMVGGSAFNSKVLCEEKCGAHIYLKSIEDGVKEAEYLYEQKRGTYER